MPLLVMRSENLPLLEGDSFSLDTKLSAFNDLITFSFKVRLGIYYLTNSGAWVTSADSIFNSLGRRD
jgi:hypothetical protein